MNCKLHILGAALLLLPAPFFGSDEVHERAKAGEVAAMLQLGDECFTGKNRQVNRVLGAYWYGKAAAKQDLTGLYRYGLCWENGWGVDRNPLKAFECYARSQKYAPSRLRMAKMLFYGVPGKNGTMAVPPNQESALRIMRLMIAGKYAPARMELVNLLNSNKNLRKKYAVEIRSLLGAQFNSGDRSPEFLLFYAKFLQEGSGGNSDRVLARALLEVAADSGNPAAQCAFARVLEFGIGTHPDPDRALDYYRRAALNGDPAALVRIGDYMLEGTRLSLDPEGARKNFELAAGKGLASAWRKVGWCCENGIGGAKDLRAACQAYERAAGGQDASGAYHAGRCFLEGIGVPADPAGAVFFFRQGAQLGDAGSMLELGRCLLKGRGCTQNPAAGRLMVAHAAKAGNAEAQRLLKTLPPAEPLLTPGK